MNCVIRTGTVHLMHASVYCYLIYIPLDNCSTRINQKCIQCLYNIDHTDICNHTLTLPFAKQEQEDLSPDLLG